MKEIKVVVTYTPGYQKRFTEACLEVLKKREAREKAMKHWESGQVALPEGRRDKNAG